MRTYLDHASTSPTRPSAVEAMLGWIGAADPGRLHTEGRMARVAVEDARERVARLLGTRPRQVIFTSGATEAINAAVHGALASDRGTHVVVPEVEHSAVRDSSANRAGRVTWVGVDRTGRVDPEAIFGAIDAGTALVHCQWANHEVGTIQPVRAVVTGCRERGILVHVDAASAVGHVPIDFDGLGADLLSFSGHKFGAPKGSGALLVRRGLRLPPLLVGGAQERGRRAGLEDVPAIIGLGAAAEELLLDGRLAAEASLQRRHIHRLREAALALDGVVVHGSAAPETSLPHLLCLGVAGVEAEAVLLGLDQAGVAVHSGSACSSESLEPSPVLAAMGVAADQSLRLSVGWSTSDEDIARAVAAIGPVVTRLRSMALS